MSDPLSVTASAAGIISLGLQVTQGIFSFCSAWKGYGGDMEDLRNKATALANGLRHLDHVLHKTSSVDPAFKTQAVDLLDSSKIMMEKLEKLRAKLPTPPTKRLATETAREIKRKMLYTFEKQTLMEMRSMIDSLQGNIDTALNILQVHQGTRLLDDVATHTALSLDIRDQLAEHTARLDSLESLLRDVHKQRYMVAPSLLRSLHEDSQHLIKASNGSNSNNCGRHTSSAHVMGSKRKFLQDSQCGKSRDRLILNKRFQICNKVLQFSLTVSLAITKGAGGCAISPMICYRCFRDFKKTDIFVTAKLLPALKLLYGSGKARPTDVTGKGETMLHLVSSGRTADVRWESDYSKLRQVINYLIREGVPTDMLTDMNMTALDCMLRNLQPKPLVHALISDMANAGCYITDNALKLWNRPLIRYIILHHPGAVCLSYPALVIFQETERELVTLVGSGQLCGDHIIGEYTALQLATGWPAGIKILLDAGADMTKDGKGNKYTHGYSNPLSWVIPSNCPASLLVFLRAGASLQPNHIGLAIYLSTPEVIDTLVNELIRRRQSLRELALLALPKHISYTLRLSQDVLPDANAPVIFDALRDAGIPVNTSMDPRGLHRGDVGHEYGTIFHERQLDRQLMDRLYDAGFVDVDTLDSAGYSPLMIAGFNSSTREDCQRVGWLLSKGAKITNCLPGTSIPAVHAIAYRVIEQVLLPRRPEGSDTRLSSTPDLETIIFLKEAFTTDLHDACNCSCSPESGCTPLSVAIRELFWPSLIERLWVALPRLLRVAPMTLEAAKTLIRLATFTDLELTHTCCREGFFFDRGFILQPFDPYEAERICEEQAELTAKCNQLVASFVKQYQSLNIPLMQFIQEYWCPQMQEYLLSDGTELDEGGSTQLHDLGISLSPSTRLHSGSLCVRLHPKVTEGSEDRGK